MRRIVLRSIAVFSIFLGLAMFSGCNSQRKDDGLMSHLSAEIFPACQSDLNFSAFLKAAQYCATSQPGADFDNYCSTILKVRQQSLKPSCRAEAAEIVGRSITSLLATGLDGLAINQGKYLDLTALDSWFKRVALYFNNYSSNYAYPQSNSDDKSYDGQKAASLLAAKVMKLVNGYNNDFPLNRSMRLPDNPNESVPVRSAELEVLKHFVGVFGNGVGPQSSQFFGFLLIGLLRSEEDAIIRMARIHDLTCRIAPCAQNVRPDFSEMIRMFAQLQSRDENVLKGINLPPNASPLAYGVLEIIRDSNPGKALHSSLIRLVASPAKPNYLAELLAQKARLYNDLDQNFTSNRLFFRYDDSSISIGLDRGTYSQLPGLLSSYKTALDTRESEYLANLNDWQNKFRDGINAEAEEYSLDKQVDINASEIANIETDLHGLRTAVKQGMNSIAAYTRQIQELDANKAYGFYPKQIEGKPQINVPVDVNADSVKWTNGKDRNDLGAFAFKVIGMSQGEMINGRVQGVWSPVCAVKKTFPVNFNGVTVGPDGFMLSRSSSGFVVESRDKSFRDTKYVEIGVRIEMCQTASVGGGFIVESKVTNSMCAYLNTGERREWTQSTSKNQGSRLDETAAFQGGILSDSTPARKYPAGSLLAYVMPRGVTDPSRALSVQVLERNFSIVAPSDTDVYFVANDCKEASIDYKSLNITYDHSEPASMKMRAALSSMLSILKSNSKNFSDLLAQGTDITAQLQTLRASILAQFAQENPESLNLPAVGEFFSYWIDNESLRIQQSASILAKERVLARLFDEDQRLGRLKSASVDLKYLAQESFARVTHQVDFLPVAEVLDDVTDLLHNQVLPLVTFNRLSLDKYRGAALNLRSTINLSTSGRDYAKNIAHLLESLKLDTENDLVLASKLPSTIVAIRFPNPEIEDAGLSISKADKTRSTQLWEQVFNTSQNFFQPVEVKFSDLIFRSPEVPRTLFCIQNRTVIQEMNVVLAFDSSIVESVVSAINGSRDISLSMGPRFGFYAGDRTFHYSMNASNQSGFVAKLGAVRNDLADPDFTPVFSRDAYKDAARGLSPFTSYTIDGAGIRNVVSSYRAIGDSSEGRRYPAAMSDIILVFKVESYGGSQNVSSALTQCNASR